MVLVAREAMTSKGFCELTGTFYGLNMEFWDCITTGDRMSGFSQNFSEECE